MQYQRRPTALNGRLRMFLAERPDVWKFAFFISVSLLSLQHLLRPVCEHSPTELTLPVEHPFVQKYPCNGSTAVRVWYIYKQFHVAYPLFYRIRSRDAWVPVSHFWLFVRLAASAGLPARLYVRILAPVLNICQRMTPSVFLLGLSLLRPDETPSALVLWFLRVLPLLDIISLGFHQSGFALEAMYGVTSLVLLAWLGRRYTHAGVNWGLPLPLMLLTRAVSTAVVLFVEARWARARQRTQALKAKLVAHGSVAHGSVAPPVVEAAAAALDGPWGAKFAESGPSPSAHPVHPDVLLQRTYLLYNSDGAGDGADTKLQVPAKLRRRQPFVPLRLRRQPCQPLQLYLLKSPSAPLAAKSFGAATVCEAVVAATGGPTWLAIYRPRMRVLSAAFKISGVSPEDLASGYESRIAESLAARGVHLDAVYVRRGCIEMVVDARLWARARASDAEGSSAWGIAESLSVNSESVESEITVPVYPVDTAAATVPAAEATRDGGGPACTALTAAEVTHQQDTSYGGGADVASAVPAGIGPIGTADGNGESFGDDSGSDVMDVGLIIRALQISADGWDVVQSGSEPLAVTAAATRLLHAFDMPQDATAAAAGGGGGGGDSLAAAANGDVGGIWDDVSTTDENAAEVTAAAAVTADPLVTAAAAAADRFDVPDAATSSAALPPPPPLTIIALGPRVICTEAAAALATATAAPAAAEASAVGLLESMGCGDVRFMFHVLIPSEYKAQETEILVRSQGRCLPIGTKSCQAYTVAAAMARVAAAPNENAVAADGGGDPIAVHILSYTIAVPVASLPTRPGLLVVEARWAGQLRGSAVPVLVMDDPWVSAELQAAAESWQGSMEELQDFLLDMSGFVRQCALGFAEGWSVGPKADRRCSDEGRGTAATSLHSQPQRPLPSLPSLLRDLGLHMLRFLVYQAGTWPLTVAWLRNRLLELGADAAVVQSVLNTCNASGGASVAARCGAGDGGIATAQSGERLGVTAPDSATADEGRGGSSSAGSGGGHCAVAKPNVANPPEFRRNTGDVSSSAVQALACPDAIGTNPWPPSPASAVAALTVDQRLTMRQQVPAAAAAMAAVMAPEVMAAAAAAARPNSCSEVNPPVTGPYLACTDETVPYAAVDGRTAAAPVLLRRRWGAAAAAAAAEAKCPAVDADGGGRRGTAPSVGMRPWASGAQAALSRAVSQWAAPMDKDYEAFVAEFSAGTAHLSHLLVFLCVTCTCTRPTFRKHHIFRPPPALHPHPNGSQHPMLQHPLQQQQQQQLLHVLQPSGWSSSVHSPPTMTSLYGTDMQAGFLQAVPVVLTCVPYTVTAVSWVLLPRRRWVHCVQAVAVFRPLAEIAAEVLMLLVAAARSPPTTAYLLGGGVWLGKGLVCPATTIISPRTAVLIAVLRLPLNAGLWLALGAPYGATVAFVRATALACMYVVVNAISHVILRTLHRRRRRSYTPHLPAPDEAERRRPNETLAGEVRCGSEMRKGRC
ncbi:hypothetical protein VaNZ11_013063 [Volvox africanus]|uniref:Mannosyltransferase n=1 Tax=Volvox africanus TaxID=51714 RepID=A0ABQ5SGK2_9CHLO|nr:hypothetical protein VaNZ11_013063 [Volvox africanus]